MSKEEKQQIRIKGEEKVDYPKDCKRIKEVLANRGYWATFEQCEVLWKKYSKSMAAGWMKLPDKDEKIMIKIRPYFEEKPSEYL